MAEERVESSGPKRWRDRAAGPRAGGAAPSGRRRKVVLMLGAILALAGAAAALLFFLSPFDAPYFVTIPVTEYTSRELPPDPFAEQDSDALLARFPEARRKKAFQSQQRDRLAQELAGLKGRTETAVVVHLRALALARGGDVFLLPANADLDDRATWLPLADVLLALRQCPAPHRLLLLDVMQPVAGARLGALADDVAGRVRAALESSDDKGLFVLCACSPGQASLVSEELGQSVFGYYLAEGLGGRADGCGPGGQRDGRVTVRELAAFVTARVDRWAAQDRNTRQVPLLLGGGDDFAVAQAPDKPALPPEPAPAPAYPAWLKAGWEARDRWGKEDAVRVAPQDFGRLEAVLVRAERRWRAGAGDDRVRDELAVDLKGLEERLQQARALAAPHPEPHPRALALARTRGAGPDAAAGDAVRALLARLDAGTPPKPEELEKEKAGLAAKYAGEAPSRELAGAVFAALADDPAPGRGKVRLAAGLLAAAKPVPRFVEALLVERLAAWDVEDWPTEAVRRLLDAARAEGEALAGDPRALAGFGEPLRAAAQGRRDAELLLFTGGSTMRGRAADLLTGAAGRYRTLTRHIDAVARAQRLSDEAFALLPDYVTALAARRDLDPRDERDWKAAVRAADELAQLLAPAAPPSEDDLQKPGDALRGALAALKQTSRPDPLVNAAGADAPAKPADYLEIQALLAGPRAGAADREALWQAGQKVARRLLQDTLAQDRSDDDKASRTPAPAEAGDADGAERERAARRARLSLDLLKLGGVSGLEPLEREVAGAAGKADLAAWEPVASKLRQAWTERLPKQLKAEKDLTAADRLSRILLAPEVGEGKSPAARLRRREVLDMWKWLGEHYRAEAESKLFAGQEAYRSFYEDAGAEYQRMSP